MGMYKNFSFIFLCGKQNGKNEVLSKETKIGFFIPPSRYNAET